VALLGLGSETDNLPTFVVMTSSDRAKLGPTLLRLLLGRGLLPSRFQGVRFRKHRRPCAYLANPAGTTREFAPRHARTTSTPSINRASAGIGDPEIETRIAQYEMAFRMQNERPDLVDSPTNRAATIARYAPDALAKGTFANNCLALGDYLSAVSASCSSWHAGWDQHSNCLPNLEGQCATLKARRRARQDLKRPRNARGSLVVWA